ncbi:Fic family protein [Agromyces archimandritae]|uniref:Fic family protein n=1 Tax=Agromyces archimandritae TaxID=2781962 RepID=A0A975FQ14_9MICO|nr:Fic family protein [Agromyces archimandritae]QTX05922.1 Fic family protein [Agromyces archimandritae]
MPTDGTNADEGRVDVPATGTSRHEWRPRHPEIFSRAETLRQTGPYDSAVPSAISAWSPRFPAALITDLDEASRALLEFDRYALDRLGAGNPALGPMSAILLRTESASSSQIEQLTASARQLALAEIDEGDRANAGVVVANVRAMEAALALSEHLDLDSILAMHRALLARQPGLEGEAGRLRTELVWIGGRDNAGPRGADFIASQPGLIRPALDDLVAFIDRVDLPVLAQLAVAHAQFETIHPFVDGNGRTGRALAQAMLRNKRLATHTTVPISAGLLIDTPRYFDALGAYREGDAGPILRSFADAARFAAVSGRGLVEALAGVLDESRAKLAGVRSVSRAWDVVPHLIAQPVVNTRHLRESLGLTEMTALRAVETLTERGVLVERTGRARNRVWQHPGVLDALDGYAAEIRRSTRHR